MSNYVPGSVWFYAPNKVAPIIFCVLFTITGCVHAWQTIRYKLWRLTLCLPWSAFLFVAGFAVREAGAFHFKNVGLLIASTVLILSGPPIYSCANYLILGRMLYYIPYLSPMHPHRVVTTFIGFDVIIEVLTANGASRFANSTLDASSIRSGLAEIKAALIMQVLAFVAFASVAVVFHLRAARAGMLTRKLRTSLWALYGSCFLITARSIYRVVEFFTGYAGAYRHEFLFYIFEAALMLLNSLLLNVFHPGRYLPRSNKVYLAVDGVTELEGPGWEDPRKWYVAAVDPFDLWGIVTRRDAKTEYWQQEKERLAQRGPAAAGAAVATSSVPRTEIELKGSASAPVARESVTVGV